MFPVNSKIAQALFPLLTVALLATACSDSTSPLNGEGADPGSAKTELPGSPGDPSIANPDLSQSVTESGLSAQPGAPAVAQAGADSVAQIGGLGPDGRAESVPQGARPGDVIPGQFIVMFKDDVRDAPGLAKRLTAEHRGKLRLTFQGIKGFSATLPTAAAEALRRNPNVAAVAPNTVGSTATTQYTPTGNDQPWGLDRIDQRYGPLSGTMTYSHTGAGVNAYIIDSGIRASHGEFGGRARNVATVFGDAGDDCFGHGTHVAGTVGGATYGVAKKVQLRGVKVLNCSGDGTAEMAVAGINWVYLYRVNPAVTNISLQWKNNPALNIATTRLANSGVFVAVAAGNWDTDACQISPAMAPGTFTVAASTSTDARASYLTGASPWASNWGKCVDAYAPGDRIRSAGLATYSTVKSGTSVAAPHVAGVAALYKQAYGNVASATIVSDLKSWSTTNIISSGSYGSTPNRLVYKGGL